MIANKTLLVFFLTISTYSFSQKTKNYFKVELNNPEYIVFINGKVNGENIDDEKRISISDRLDYEKKVKENKKSFEGYPLKSKGISFNVLSESIIDQCEYEKIDFVDFDWLIKNEYIKTPGNIELNNFKNLKLILIQNDDYLVFDVIKRFSSH